MEKLKRLGSRLAYGDLTVVEGDLIHRTPEDSKNGFRCSLYSALYPPASCKFLSPVLYCTCLFIQYFGTILYLLCCIRIVQYTYAKQYCIRDDRITITM